MKQYHELFKKFTELPLAVEPFKSYRCKCQHGYIMLGATDDDDAFKQARLLGEVIKENLERWNGEAYEPCYNLPIPQPTKD